MSLFRNEDIFIRKLTFSDGTSLSSIANLSLTGLTTSALTAGTFTLKNSEPLLNLLGDHGNWQVGIDVANPLTYRDFVMAAVYTGANSVGDLIYLKNNQLYTTLASAVAKGATSLPLAASLDLGTGSHVLLGTISAKNQEYVTVTAGSRTSTLTITATQFAHAQGESVSVTDDPAHPVTLGIFSTPPPATTAVTIAGANGALSNNILDLLSPQNFTGHYLTMRDSAGHADLILDTAYNTPNSSFSLQQLVNSVSTPVLQSSAANPKPIIAVGVWDAATWQNWSYISLAVYQAIGFGTSGGNALLYCDGGGATLSAVSNIALNLGVNNASKWQIDTSGNFSALSSGIIVTPTVKFTTALVTLGGGAAPTFGTIGGSGPATAAQNSWLLLKDSGGNNCWVPVWK